MEQMWFYTQGASDQQGPVPESRIREMIASGTLGSTDLVWSEGLPDWAPVSQMDPFRDAFAAGPATAAPRVLPDRLLGWMTFVGVMTLITGIIQCLSCVGILIGVFMIIAGVALLGAKTALGAAQVTDAGLIPFFEKLNSFMIMSGVAYIVTVIMYVVLIVIYLGAFMATLSGALQNAP